MDETMTIICTEYTTRKYVKNNKQNHFNPNPKSVQLHMSFDITSFQSLQSYNEIFDSRKTVPFTEQITSEQKYPRLFSRLINN